MNEKIGFKFMKDILSKCIQKIIITLIFVNAGVPLIKLFMLVLGAPES